MTDTVWMALAMARLAVRCEMLEQEVAALRQAAEAAKGPQEVKEEKNADSWNTNTSS